MRDYPPRALAFVEGIAEELGVWLYPNLRTYNGTDALEPRVAGYETVALCSCTDQKQPGRYHWPNDVAEQRQLRDPPTGGRDQRFGHPAPRRRLALSDGLQRDESRLRARDLAL